VPAGKNALTNTHDISRTPALVFDRTNGDTHSPLESGNFLPTFLLTRTRELKHRVHLMPENLTLHFWKDQSTSQRLEIRNYKSPERRRAPPCRCGPSEPSRSFWGFRSYLCEWRRPGRGPSPAPPPRSWHLCSYIQVFWAQLSRVTENIKPLLFFWKLIKPNIYQAEGGQHGRDGALGGVTRAHTGVRGWQSANNSSSFPQQ